MILLSSLDPYLIINQITLFLIDIFAVWLIIVVYSAGPKRTLNRLFTLLTLAFLFWGNGGYFFAFSKNLDFSLFLGRLILGEVSLFFIVFYFFSVYFPYKDKTYPILDKIVLLFGFGLFFLTAFTDLIVRSVRITEWGIDPVFNPIGKFIFYGLTAFFTFLILFQLFKKYFTLTEKDKLRVQYFLMGISIFILMNIIFNIFLPTWRNSIQYWQFGNYSAILLLGLAAFAIVKQELFGIKVILTQTLVGIIAILLLTQAVTASGWDLAWKFALFLIFLPFGYFLIQSVVREIQRRTELQRLYEQVDKLSRAKSEFISIASHQLRTPLTAIKGYISMLIEGTYGKLTGRTIPPMEKVYQSNERLIKLVNDLLHVSRIESGTLRIDLQKTSLEDIISSVVDELRIKADERKIYLKWEKPPKPLPEITVDADKFRQVILNIIDNCIKYTEKGGITVKTEQKKPSAKFPQGSILTVIKDTGEGMTEEELEKMFESFSRGKAGAKHWTAGTGLGLYIARKFTEVHGGRVWAESPGEGKGSTFYIELPVK